MLREMGPAAFLADWRAVLAERARQATEAFARAPGVLGLILCGSVGRGEAWPLSDIDIIPIYEDGRRAEAARAVEAARLVLLDAWTAEGHGTSLDVGRLAFGRSEATQALALPPAEASRLLDDPRWFHSLDKGYRSRAAFDPTGLAAALADWLTAARFAPATVQGRLAGHWRQTLAYRDRARAALGTGDPAEGGIALHESLHALTRYLTERWGGRDNSWGRFGTRFERLAEERGEGALAGEIMALYGLALAEVARRLALAPEGIRRRHQLSFAARRLVDEPVTAAQDARDTLLVFGTRAVRNSPPPFAAWVGLEADPAARAGRLAAYDRLLAEVAARSEPPGAPPAPRAG